MLAALGAGRAGALEWSAGVDAGYTFRLAPDGRNHGAVAGVFGEIPLPAALALRPEVFALAFGPSAAAPHNLTLSAAALSLAYSFDDTEIQAIASVGPFVGLSSDGSANAVRLGALASLGLRVPVASFASLEAKVGVPQVLTGPHGITPIAQAQYSDGTAVDFPLETTFQIGVALDLEALLSELH
jgi:hypothetical protein